MKLDKVVAFTDENKADMEAALEYARRARKGLPADRFCDGTNGAKSVARGIDAWSAAFAAVVELLRQIDDAERQAGAEAMEIHHDHSKYREG